jgi:hypothetical protein
MNLDLRLYQELERILGEQLEHHASELVNGKPVDWADYRYRYGKIRGIRDALDAAREAQARVLGVEDKER